MNRGYVEPGGGRTRSAARSPPARHPTELIISHATWLRRRDFTSRFMQHIDSGIDGYELAQIDWESAIAALDAGQLVPCSGGERRMLRLAASIAGGTPISLRDTLPGLDPSWLISAYGG